MPHGSESATSAASRNGASPPTARSRGPSIEERFTGLRGRLSVQASGQTPSSQRSEVRSVGDAGQACGPVRPQDGARIHIGRVGGVVVAWSCSTSEYGCGSTPHRLSFSRVIPVKIRVPATFRASYTANSRSGVGIVLATFACPGSQLGRGAPGTGAHRRLPARLPADLRARSGQGVAPLHSAGAITSRLLPQPCRQPDSCRCSGRSGRAAKR
jgi:hypothetical protein